jgi:hypothetical protein
MRQKLRHRRHSRILRKPYDNVLVMAIKALIFDRHI